MIKYGWQINDEIESYVGNTSEIQFVTMSAYQELQEKLTVAEKALDEISDDFGTDYCDGKTMIAVEALEKIRGNK